MTLRILLVLTGTKGTLEINLGNDDTGLGPFLELRAPSGETLLRKEYPPDREWA